MRVFDSRLFPLQVIGRNNQAVAFNTSTKLIEVDEN